MEAAGGAPSHPDALARCIPTPTPPQENESKRNRAVKRAGDERRQREQKEQEIGKLKKQCRDRMDEEARLRKDLQANRRYQDFLAQVRRPEGSRKKTVVTVAVVMAMTTTVAAAICDTNTTWSILATEY